MRHPRRCGALLGRLSEFIDGELPEALCRGIRAHMSDCAACRAFVRSLRRAVALHAAQGRRGGIPPLTRVELRSQLRACAAAARRRGR